MHSNIWTWSIPFSVRSRRVVYGGYSPLFMLHPIPENIKLVLISFKYFNGRSIKL